MQYVQSVTFNGEPLDRTWLSARELHRGGQLEIALGPKPSDWGTTNRPPSVSQPGDGLSRRARPRRLPADIAG